MGTMQPLDDNHMLRDFSALFQECIDVDSGANNDTINGLLAYTTVVIESVIERVSNWGLW